MPFTSGWRGDAARYLENRPHDCMTLIPRAP
jgi:hypothetical protein